MWSTRIHATYKTDMERICHRCVRNLWRIRANSSHAVNNSHEFFIRVTNKKCEKYGSTKRSLKILLFKELETGQQLYPVLIIPDIWSHWFFFPLGNSYVPESVTGQDTTKPINAIMRTTIKFADQPTQPCTLLFVVWTLYYLLLPYPNVSKTSCAVRFESLQVAQNRK